MEFGGERMGRCLKKEWLLSWGGILSELRGLASSKEEFASKLF